MVRILKVKELEHRKRVLLAQSAMYRETLRIEVANVKFSVALLRRKFNFAKSALGVISVAAPVLGLLVGLRGFSRRQHAPSREGASASPGLLGKIMGAARLFRQVRPLWHAFLEGRRAAHLSRERRNLTEFP